MKCLLLIAFVVVAISADESLLKEFTNKSVPFIAKLYKQLRKVNSGNFLVSPLSLQTIFALVNNGARGNTAKQITCSLRLPEEDKIKETFLRFTKNLQSNDKYTLNSINKMYLKNNFQISPQFKNNAVKVFNSEIQNIDLSNAKQAVAEINKWVEEKTHAKIKDLLKEEMINEQHTLAVLINALYFQGKWVKQFDDIHQNLFSLNNNDFVIIDMMTMSDDFNYYRNDELNAKFLEMPYEGDDITMTFVLPLHVDGLSNLEERISDLLVTPPYEVHRMDVVIPKFKIETTTLCIPILQAMGITDAFNDAANFTGVGERQEGLFISEVVQKTFIEVDEKGTTAAAASAVSLDDRSFNEYQFVADHPFIFYLKHRINGILFIGKFAVPEVIYDKN